MHDLDQYSPPDAYYHDPGDDHPEPEPDLGFFQDKVAAYLRNQGHPKLSDAWLQDGWLQDEQYALFMARLYAWDPKEVAAALIRMKGREYMKGILVYNIKWNLQPQELAQLENEWTRDGNGRIHWSLMEVTKLPSAVWLDDVDVATLIKQYDDPNQYVCDILSESYGFFVEDYSLRQVEMEEAK